MTLFDRSEASRWEALLSEAGISPTLFPLHPHGRYGDDGRPLGGTPAIRWGGLEAGEIVPAAEDDQGYGLATGSRSGGLVVLDVDAKGADGFASLADLERRWGPLPDPTLTVASPHGGGIHIYLRHPGAFQTNAGKIAPGLDVRAEGGYVRIPGSPHARGGIYTVDVAAPPALLPGGWADNLPRYRAASADPIDVEALEIDPDELRERLRETAKGKRGPAWAAWRKIAEGERFVRVHGGKAGDPVPDGYAGVDEWIVKGLFGTLARAPEGEWYRVSPDEFAALVEPSFSIVRSDVAATGGTSKYTPDVIREKWARTLDFARRELAERDKNEALAERLRSFVESEEEPEFPWLIVHSGAYYVRAAEPPIRYRGPKVRNDLWTTARREWAPNGPDVYKPSKNGPVRMSVDDMLESYGYPVDTVEHALAAQSPRVEERKLILPGPSIAVQPREHPEIGRWLEALGGAPLLDWIAIVTDLTYAAPALWLTGAPGVGKSLLALGLARIWNTSPTPMEIAFARFNDSILDCPLVFGDEEIPRARDGRPDVEALKRLIADTRRKIDEKHKPIRDVSGAARVLLASNNTNLIRTAADLTAEDAQALAERFVHLHIPPERGPAIRALFPTGGEVQRAWIEGAWIAEHALHLAQNRHVPMGPRLRMAPVSDRLRRMLITQPGAGFLVCHALYDWTIAAARAMEAGEAPQSAEILWADGTVFCTASGVMSRIPADERRHSRKQIGQTLRRFSSGESPRRDPAGVPRKYWRIDLENIRVWAEEEGWGDPEAFDRAVAILTAKSQKESQKEGAK